MDVLGGVMSPILEFCLDDIRSRIAAGIVPGTTVPEVRLSVLGSSTADWRSLDSASPLVRHFQLRTFRARSPRLVQ
jgi:hypothetical protein